MTCNAYIGKADGSLQSAKASSVKVKRLFLYLSEKQNYAWLKRLNLSNVDFGTGARQIVKGKVFDPKYRITVPEEANQ